MGYEISPKLEHYLQEGRARQDSVVGVLHQERALRYGDPKVQCLLENASPSSIHRLSASLTPEKVTEK